MSKQLLSRIKRVLSNEKREIKTVGMGFFRAAVLIPLIIEKDKESILFEVRASEMAWQPGEICFPGGKVEPRDANEKEAAIRETVEELGINAKNIEVIGEMGEVVSPIGVILKPYIGIIEVTDYKLSKKEVAQVFKVPLAMLLDMKPIKAHMEMGNRPLDDFPFELVPHYNDEWKRRRTYEVLFYKFEDRVIWGLTAQVLSDFIDICRN
ncbi:NUDIX hydrolase [Dendrosporobacter sp. 1207_IL3150]|uniref:NUDIX hydrolase n=1 Tax=Dendrosporobacter sp. 1207_IL3150 TaxID=3084054 RepID=UPI002FDA6096